MIWQLAHQGSAATVTCGRRSGPRSGIDVPPVQSCRSAIRNLRGSIHGFRQCGVRRIGARAKQPGWDPEVERPRPDVPKAPWELCAGEAAWPRGDPVERGGSAICPARLPGSILCAAKAAGVRSGTNVVCGRCSGGRSGGLGTDGQKLREPHGDATWGASPGGPRSLVTKRFNGIELRRLPGRIQPKRNPNKRAEHHRDANHVGLDQHGPSESLR